MTTTIKKGSKVIYIHSFYTVLHDGQTHVVLINNTGKEISVKKDLCRLFNH